MRRRSVGLSPGSTATGDGIALWKWAHHDAEKYLYSQMAMEELFRRGESVESFRSFISMELDSNELRSRYFGEGNAKRFLPDLLGKIRRR